ncbi:hypothetical protein G5V59_21620 [Nocardioides sp. W3-2-3]|uniref:hypothetical protein n=1 Tax=Nocardioides convexus TaxID=2712224 RepID=UPI0024184FA8|nr:hypothetical protein [Nocardioides convexus]NHA01518.1 hypothetical protein [Nocardioides convexus]
MDKGVSSAGRRLRVITVDQAVSGASNVLILVLAAQVLGVEAFGLYGIVFTAFVTVQGCLRALLCEPLLVHPEEAEERPGDAIGTTTLLGLGAGVLLVVAGLVTHLWHAELAGSFIVLGVCMPLIALQDLGRYLGFTTHRPSFSLMIDTVWLVLMIAVIVLLAVLDHRLAGHLRRRVGRVRCAGRSARLHPLRPAAPARLSQVAARDLVVLLALPDRLRLHPDGLARQAPWWSGWRPARTPSARCAARSSSPARSGWCTWRRSRPAPRRSPGWSPGRRTYDATCVVPPC